MNSDLQKDAQSVLLIAHHYTAKLADHLSSAACAAGHGASPDNADLCSSLRKARRQVALLHTALQQAVCLGSDSDDDDDESDPHCEYSCCY